MKTLKAIVMEYGKELLEAFEDEFDVDTDGIEINYKLDLWNDEVDVRVYKFSYEKKELNLENENE